MKKKFEYIYKRRNDEATLQQLLVNWLDANEILYVASLMGVNLGPRVGAIRKRMGCRAGVPDILILQPSHNYHGMSIELKVKGGKVSKEQEAFATRLSKNGYYSVIMPPHFGVEDGLIWAQSEIKYYLELENLKKVAENIRS